MTDLPQKGKYRHEIDGLRALAVTAATINNLWEDILPCGYLGVDMFAVVSGYAITASIYGRKHESFKAFLVGFYSKRFRRLIPGLILVVLVISVLSVLVVPTVHIVSTIRTGGTSLIGVSNIYLLLRSTDYFSLAAKLNPFTATWSLSCEEQYYAIFPIILWTCGFAKHSINGAKNLFLLIISLSVASLVGFTYLWHVNQSAAYFLMPTRFWEMGLGSLACLLYEKQMRRAVDHPPRDISFLFVACIIGLFFIPLSQGLLATYGVALSTFFILVFCQDKSFSYNLLCVSCARFIARISYALYLWRWSLISILLWIFGSLDVYLSVFALILIIVAATLSTFFVEEPMRSEKQIACKPLYLPITSLVFSSLFLSISSVAKIRIVSVKHYAENLECNETQTLSKLNKCFTRKTNEPTIFVIGSSHAIHLVPGLIRIKKALGYSDIVYAKQSGRKFNRVVLQSLRQQVHERDLILYSRDQDSLLQESKGTGNLVFPKFFFTSLPPLRLKEELAVLRDIAISKKTLLYLVDDVPSFQANEYQNSLISNIFSRRTGVSLQEALSRRQNYTRLLETYVDNRNIFRVDPIFSFCSRDWCGTIKNGRPLYSDDSPHISQENPDILDDFFIKNLPKAIISVIN